MGGAGIISTPLGAAHGGARLYRRNGGRRPPRRSRLRRKRRSTSSIVQDITVARPADVVWKKVGGYCDIAAWFKTTCVYTVGSGGIGTNRLIAGRINEVMVARTSTAYVYAQPLAPNSYHGTVEIVPAPGGSRIIYSLFYDLSTLPDQAAKDKDKATRAKNVHGRPGEDEGRRRSALIGRRRYSTVTDLARLRGWSTSVPLCTATW